MKMKEDRILQQLQLDSFQKPFEVAIQEQRPTVMWRLPQSKKRHLIIDLRERLSQQKLDLEANYSGFAISPFNNSSGQETYFIHSDLHFQWEAQKVKLIENFSQNDNQLVSHKSKLIKQLSFHQSAHGIEPHLQILENSKQQENYEQIVTKAVQAIQKNQFDKVVLARQKFIQFSERKNWLKQFEKLCENYSHAFVYLFHLPKIGTWLGATPETLISVDKNQIFKTMSLAGTQAFNPEKKPAQALWSQKEIEEQALVSRYIIECFKKIRLREFKEDGPKTIVAGNLMHLKTNFEVDMQATNFPQLGTVMLELLHPTSAVCGMPKTPALHFIQENEDFNRKFYSGFLGPVNMKEESHLFVNLRCLQIQDKKGILYTGAGITADSIPEKEWEETEMKSQTLINVLQKSQ